MRARDCAISRDHAVEGAREIGELVGARDRDAHREIALRDDVDRGAEPVDALREAAREGGAEDDRHRSGDAEQQREDAQVALVEVRARRLELVIARDDDARALELVEPLARDRERRDEHRRVGVVGQRATHLEAALGRRVDGATAIAAREDLPARVLDGERDELGKCGKSASISDSSVSMLRFFAASRSTGSAAMATVWCFRSSLMALT